ncbi:MAG: XdhC family protein [Blautia sp.]
MADRTMYEKIAECVRKQDEVFLETVLEGPHAGEKRILSQQEEKISAEKGVYREVLYGKPKAVVCGGGHVSLAIVQLLKMLEFTVVVVDERPEFANRERFPEADEIYCMEFADFFRENKFGKHAYYIIVTRGHQYDYSCLKAVLERERDYVGMIGSRSKVALSFEKLRKEGYPEDVIGSIHSPIGLAIGAKTPAEISVSIAAEIIQEKNRHLRNTLEASILEGIQDEDACTMVTVIEKSGSSPRGEGTRMIVCRDGRIYGTIGGGSVEYAAIQEAKGFDDPSGFAVKEYDLTNSKAATLGMVCGGHVKVLFEKL